MFAIYDIQGRRFRNTLEQLRKVQKTPASQRVALRPQDTEQSRQNFAEPPADHTAKDHSGSVDARKAYQEILHVTEREAILHAHQLMSYPVETVQMTLDIVSAWKYLRRKRYHQLPVLNRQQRIVGMLSERDLLYFLVIEDEQLRYVEGKTVADAMSAEVITADPVSDVRRIANVMLDYRLSALPIVDERDALIGLVSRSDILHAVASNPPLSLWT